MPRVVIVGAGASGLACAEALRSTGDEVDVLLLEASARPGGRIGSVREDGFVFEEGPHALLDNAPETLALVKRAGLADRMIRPAPEARLRFVLSGGRLHPLPTAPASFLKSPLLPFRAKARALAEPLIRRRADREESVAEFFARRFGPGVVGPLVHPFVTGVFGGDPERLSMSAAFPKVWRLEREHGSVVRGLVRGKRPSPPSLFSFREGMEELAGGVARLLGGALRTGCAVRAIEKRGRQFFLEVAGGSADRETVAADAVVLAVPAPAAARLVAPIDPDFGPLLEAIPYAPLAVVCLTYDEKAFERPPRGFGYLRARGEDHPLLGCIFSSSVFPEHAPPGQVSLRALLGGAQDPERAALLDEELVEAARRALEPLLGARREPTRARVFRYARAIPQYTLGHLARRAAIEAKQREHPGLFLTGAAYRGVSVNDCIADGRATARRVADHLDGLR